MSPDATPLLECWRLLIVSKYFCELIACDARVADAEFVHATTSWMLFTTLLLDELPRLEDVGEPRFLFGQRRHDIERSVLCGQDFENIVA